MRIGIFYITDEHYAKASPIDYESMFLPSGHVVYIRVEEVNENSLLTAMDKARPRKGESLMNAHRLDR